MKRSNKNIPGKWLGLFCLVWLALFSGVDISIVTMDKECVVYDGYMVYKVSGTRGVRFIVDQGGGEQRIIVPMFRIANGIVRAYNWNGDTSKDSEIEEQYKCNSDYECLQANVDAAKEQYDSLGHTESIRTTVIIVGDDNYFGIAIFPGIVVGRVQEEVIPLHC